MRCSLVSIVSLLKLSFTFGFHLNGLNNFCNDNLFSHTTLKGDFIVLNLDDSYNNIFSTFVSYFDSDSKCVK